MSLHEISLLRSVLLQSFVRVPELKRNKPLLVDLSIILNRFICTRRGSWGPEGAHTHIRYPTQFANPLPQKGPTTLVGEVLLGGICVCHGICMGSKETPELLEA